MKVFLTGATGFVGTHLLQKLLSTGEEVHALVRKPDAAERLRAGGVKVWMGDLANTDELAKATKGADVVIHSAGIVRPAAAAENAWEVNVNGTQRLLAASAANGVSRFIFISSGSIYGFAPPPISESTPKNPTGEYGKSKWAAEKAVWRAYTEQELPVVVLRPCTILGQSNQEFGQRIAGLLRRRVLPFPEGGRRLFDLVYISDVVDAILAAITAPSAIGQAYNITDGERHSYRDIVTAYVAANGNGNAPRILPVPGRLVTAIQGILVRSMQRRGRPQAQIERVQMLSLFNQDLHYAIDAARTDLGYKPQVRLQEALRRMNTQSGQQSQA